MSKFLLNLLVQISKALVNSKIQFLIQKFLFLIFGPAELAAHSASGPASSLASLPPQAETARPTHLARASSREYVFPFGSRLPSWPPLPHLSVKQASLVSFVFPTAPADPGRETSASPTMRLGCRQDFTAPILIIPPLNPLQTEP
jgi:hypothetical protein